VSNFTPIAISENLRTSVVQWFSALYHHEGTENTERVST